MSLALSRSSSSTTLKVAARLRMQEWCKCTWPWHAVVRPQPLCKLGNVGKAKALCLLETVEQNVEWENRAHPRFVPSIDQLLFFMHWNILCHETFVSWSLQSEVCLLCLVLKPHPEAKLCFYEVDESKHVCAPRQHQRLRSGIAIQFYWKQIFSYFYEVQRQCSLSKVV